MCVCVCVWVCMCVCVCALTIEVLLKFSELECSSVAYILDVVEGGCSQAQC